MSNPSDLFDLAGKNAAITGGAGILFSSVSKGLAARGVNVAILDMAIDGAQALANEINALGNGRAIAVDTNVLERESVEAAAAAVSEAFGPTDILINGAGGNRTQATTDDQHSFFDIPVDAMQWVFNLNFIGTLLPSQVFAKQMAERQTGIILNVSSMSALRPLTRIAGYSGAKAAVSNFTQWLAVHLAQEYSPALRVNAIAPGFFLTEQNRFLLTNEDGSATTRGQQILDHTPMGRYGEPDDLLGTVIWLLSDASRFISGIVVPIDGGFSAYSGV